MDAYEVDGRCGYCGSPGELDRSSQRCNHCGSALESEAGAIKGARWPHLIKRWLRSRDRGWELVQGMRAELSLRVIEDMKEGRDPKRFDGVPDPMTDLEDYEQDEAKERKTAEQLIQVETFLSILFFMTLVLDTKDVIKVDLAWNEKWARSEFPHPLIIVDYNANDEPIAISGVGPKAFLVLESYCEWVRNNQDASQPVPVDSLIERVRAIN